jgi:hypothetical protein
VSEVRKARVTITHEYELRRTSYRYTAEGERRTDEELAALTPEEMVQEEHQNLIDGTYGIEELLDELNYEDDVKFEVLPEED